MKRSKDFSKSIVTVIALVLAIISCVLFLLAAVFNWPFTKKQVTEEYTKNQNSIELQYKISLLANRLDLIIDTMKEDSQFIFGEDDFKYHDLYVNYIIYGDNNVVAANDIEGKLLFLGNLIGNINFHMDDILVYYYSLGNDSKYSYLYSDINKDIAEINKIINTYNEYNDTKLIHLGYLKDSATNDDLIKAKERWEIIQKEN